jgi:cell division protein FtsW
MAERSYDRLLLISTLALVALGVLMVYSSTSVVTPVMERKHIAEFFYLKKHLFTVAIGLVGMYMACKVDRDLLKKMAIPLLLLALILLLMVFIPGIGVKAGGAKRWLRLWPSTFQPSELVKLAMVFFLAWYMSMNSYRTDRFVFFAIPVGVMAVFQLIFLKQPDFGAAMSLGVLTICMLFISGIRLRYLGSLVLMAVPVLYYLLSEPYRMKRLITFIDPWKYRSDGGFQLVQSFIAFGSGGMSGVGLGKSMQKLDFLPEVHTDFIFSMLGEELGFLRAILVVALFAFIFFRGVSVAGDQREKFGYYMAFGLSLMVALQALVNIAVVTGMLPTKGLPLPFISYGGSALLVNMVVVGLLLNYSRPEGGRTEAPQDKLGTMIRKKKAKRAVYGRPR